MPRSLNLICINQPKFLWHQTTFENLIFNIRFVFNEIDSKKLTNFWHVSVAKLIRMRIHVNIYKNWWNYQYGPMVRGPHVRAGLQCSWKKTECIFRMCVIDKVNKIVCSFYFLLDKSINYGPMVGVWYSWGLQIVKHACIYLYSALTVAGKVSVFS